MAVKQPIQNPLGVAPLVQQAAQQSFAMKNGGMLPPNTAPMGSSGNMVRGRFETIQTGEAPQTNFENMEKPQEFQPQQEKVEINQPITQPYDAHTADNTPQPQSNFENMPQQPTGWNPDGSARYDALSQALSGYQYSGQPEFQKDETKRDGGFFSWLRGLTPKSRPGRRDGESDDEYDRRMTTNKERLLALGDAMRHIGNIVNTSRYAPSQQFNDPYSVVEQGYQRRSAQRRQQAAADSDAAYKQANLSLKEKAAEADRQYKAMNLGLKQAAEERAKKKADDDNKKWAANYERLLGNDEFNHKMADAKFKESQRHNKVSEGQRAQSIAISQERNNIARARLMHSISTSGGSGGGKGGMTNLSTPTGHTNRKKDLNAIEKKQLTQYLIKNGYINKKNMDAYNMYSSMDNKQPLNDLVNAWIAFAANSPGGKGAKFREVLKNHYGYVETVTTSAPKTKAGGGSVVTITQRGNKAKPTASNTSKFHVK